MSNQEEVEVSYDVSNEFFRLWLDERMNYTCGLYEGTDNLEEAQNKKLEGSTRPPTSTPTSGCWTSAAAGAPTWST